MDLSHNVSDLVENRKNTTTCI